LAAASHLMQPRRHYCLEGSLQRIESCRTPELTCQVPPSKVTGPFGWPLFMRAKSQMQGQTLITARFPRLSLYTQYVCAWAKIYVEAGSRLHNGDLILVCRPLFDQWAHHRRPRAGPENGPLKPPRCRREPSETRRGWVALCVAQHAVGAAAGESSACMSIRRKESNGVNSASRGCCSRIVPDGKFPFPSCFNDQVMMGRPLLCRTILSSLMTGHKAEG
jgi:hypothetical protein